MVSNISNSENYENKFYVQRSRSEKETGFLLASAASALVMGALPYFSKPFQKQIVKELVIFTSPSNAPEFHLNFI